MPAAVMGVAVIGGGIKGLVSAYILAKAGVDAVVYEKEERLGGHAKTVDFDAVNLDLGFLFLNPVRLFFFNYHYFEIFIFFYITKTLLYLK